MFQLFLQPLSQLDPVSVGIHNVCESPSSFFEGFDCPFKFPRDLRVCPVNILDLERKMIQTLSATVPVPFRIPVQLKDLGGSFGSQPRDAASGFLDACFEEKFHV